MTLQIHDALESVPERFVGKYDIVHVGRINLFVRNENPSPLLENFMTMLSEYQSTSRSAILVQIINIRLTGTHCPFQNQEAIFIGTS